MAYSLLFVSKTLLEYPDGEAEVGKIVVAAATRNAALGVTGALVATGTYFAQVLEGPRAAVETLMHSIDADPRHMRLRTIRTTQEQRRFASWALIYNGCASMADRHIAPFYASMPQGDAAHLAQRLVMLMQEVARLPSA